MIDPNLYLPDGPVSKRVATIAIFALVLWIIGFIWLMWFA